ncbi:N-acetylneuraminate synthase family protein [Leptospira weilii]|uniref:N-acetylneuraminate synthase family protein n=1 Tax=Leptospira weilii TaxID=28184 RepID=UPI00256EB8D8|nr:N-acetylneuraminate synthase family protein [Leptospira weilii]MDL5246461.1 N-acetylneuraminate synthase family protein [Leptospira weilii]
MEEVIRVGSRILGGEKTFIIAEVGSNHCQDLKIAYETIDAAVEAGADAIKFQSIRIDKLYLNPSAETIALHKKIDFDESWHKLLNQYCKKKDIVFFSAPTYLEAVDILEEVNVELYKLASAQVGTFPQLAERVAMTGKPVILSTGLVNYGELEKVIKIFKKAGNNKFIILHCNSIYPVPNERVHLPLMEVYKQMFQCIVGFSDHTSSIYGAIAAVSRGAKIIEKHFSLSKKFNSPDAPFSIEPGEFKSMVQGIRAAELMVIPNTRIEIEQEESKFKERIRTRLILLKPKKAGDTLQKEDFKFLRAPNGVDCSDLEMVLGSKLLIDKNENDLLMRSDLIL